MIFCLPPKSHATLSGDLMEKATISAKEIVADIRAGATDEFLMKKYNISDKGLQRLFQKLISAKVLTQAEIYHRASAVAEGRLAYGRNAVAALVSERLASLTLDVD